MTVRDALDSQWRRNVCMQWKHDRTVYRTCMHGVEITPRLHELPFLLGLKICNSVLVKWPREAALTQTTNAEMMFVSIISTNLTELPPGLYHNDFPDKLTDIELASVNLTSLPREVVDIVGVFLVMESCQSMEFPPALTQLQPSFLSIADNNFTVIPASVWENPRLFMINLDMDPVLSLPQALSTEPSFK